MSTIMVTIVKNGGRNMEKISMIIVDRDDEESSDPREGFCKKEILDMFNALKGINTYERKKQKTTA